MISFDEAYNIVVNSNCTLQVELTGLASVLGRVLAKDVLSDMDMPPFDKTAVDGYACKMSDIKNDLEIIEIIPAGKIPEKKISQGTCSKIMTGASIPQGADCVIMVEHTKELNSNTIKFIYDQTAKNICYKAEDLKKGDVVLTAGTRVDAQHIAVLASVGCTTPFVFVQPLVAVISTGNELVEPGEFPNAAQIRNSNAYQLVAQIQKAGAIANYIGIAEDTEEATFDIISKALLNNDMIILTGGVSMGDYDYVPKVLTRIGFENLFHSIAVQPGRPTVFSKYNDKFCFGLPGNPVSSFIQFELLVKPLLLKMMGNTHFPLIFKLPLAVDYSRKRSDRLSIIPVIIQRDNTIIPAEYHGSAHIHSLVSANGIMFIPLGVTSIKEGELADVRQI